MVNKHKKHDVKGKKTNFIVDVFKEFSHITWPKGKEFKNTSFVVLVFVGMYIIYIGFFDLILKKVFNILFK